MANAVIATNLSKHYDRHTALDGLNLTVGDGEIFGFLGHNGAGKTTTINILTTLLAPSQGQALVCGKDVENDSMAVRQLIGYVPENVRLYETISSFDNLMFFAKLSGVAHPAERIAETLKFLECPELAPSVEARSCARKPK